MTSPYSACLVDIYDTVLSVDFVRFQEALAERAGVEVDAFTAAVSLWTRAVMDGSRSLAEALEETLLRCGVPADADLVAELVELDSRLIHDLAVLHDDTVPFLRSLQERGVRTAFVSNCAENTRPLLDTLDLSRLVDELVLSCEVGAAKPDAAIFETALDRLGVDAGDALFVDDHQRYCDGAAAVGIRALRIDRRGGAGEIASLAELHRHF
jgi:HAD superfamily hydrolase (TIGR01509 family)